MRHLFGGTTSDYAMQQVGNQLLLRPGATGQVWTAVNGGTQLTDLTDTGGVPITSVVAAADGSVAFYGPEDVTEAFIDFGFGRRYTLIASDIASTVSSRLDSLVATAADDAATKAAAAQAAAISTAADNAAALYLPSAITTVDDLIGAATPVAPAYFAHRGGGMVRPEHTMVGFRAAAAMRFPLEVSVNVDASGELWCLHDSTVDRTTNRTGLLSSYTTEEVAQQIETNSRPLLGAGWEEQRLVPLRQVLDEFLGKIPILLEPKANDAVVPCQQLLDASYPHAPPQCDLESTHRHPVAAVGQGEGVPDVGVSRLGDVRRHDGRQGC
ncbi:glycerophosphodiester phosphodiesterase [Streptomyces sp. NPDC058869]|uniref:glycerophosphodiester phosphodiesterase n=1 Tax=Streptomyces sp. NPDC058869 TaxID=3346659 RepID=UPI00367EF30C